MHQCPDCGGVGLTDPGRDDERFATHAHVTCERCGGSGEIDPNAEREDAEGWGYTPRDR